MYVHLCKRNVNKIVFVGTLNYSITQRDVFCHKVLATCTADKDDVSNRIQKRKFR